MNSAPGRPPEKGGSERSERGVAFGDRGQSPNYRGETTIASIALLLGLVVIGFPLAIFVMQEKLIFFPQPLAQGQREALKQRHPAVREVILATPDQHKIHAWHVPGRDGGPLILYFGGNAEDVSWMIPDAQSQIPGASWLLVSYRGYGGSEGSPSEKAITADALQWHDYAVRELKPKGVYVFGRSLGSGAAVIVASERQVAGAILVTPFDSLVEVAKRHYPILPVTLMLRHHFDSIGRAPKINAPLLCIAAAKDEIIPSSHARKLHDAWKGQKRWLELEGAGHNSTDGIPAFWQHIRAFVQK